MFRSFSRAEPLERRTLLAGTISGFVFNDLNGNGRLDTGDPGLPDQVLYLDLNFNGALDPNEPRQITDDSGAYSFDKLENGIYRVRHDIADARRLTAPAATYHDVPVTPLTRVVNRNFGSTDTVIIRGFVFEDFDNDARKGLGETGLAGWTVFLDKDNDGKHDPNESYRITNSAGEYRFTGLKAGTYRLRIVQQDGYLRTNPISGLWIIGLQHGQSVSNRNFGEKLIDFPHP